jgi:hypothetical protein
MSRPPQAALCLLLLLLLPLPGWIAFHRGDAPAPDDRDLRIAESRNATGENGFDRFTAAADAAHLPHDEATWRRFHAFRAGSTWEPEWISALIAENAAATSLLRAGVAAPAFAFPALDAPHIGDARMHTLFLDQQLVALAGAQARIALHDGRDRQAIELASFGLLAGRRLSAADNVDLFGIYMASAFQTLSLLDLEHVARSSRIEPETARELGALLESTRWRASDWQRVWMLEYARVRAEVGALDPSTAGWPSYLLPNAYRWHPNRTLAAVADQYREQSGKSEHFCTDAGLARESEISLASLPTASAFAPNALGRLVVEQVRARNLDRIQRNRCQFETQVSLVAVMIAAKAYSDAQGRLPERLEDLVPLYLDALPLDRYDGAPLRYARAAPAVYSIGEDESDEGGRAARGLFDTHEPELSLAFPAD